MKTHTSSLADKVRTAHFLKVAATVGLLMVSLNSTAQQIQQIEVQGKDSSWKLVGTVDPLTGFQIGAKGNVDFGGIGQNDNPNAGVNGSAFAKWAGEIFSLGVEAALQYLEGASVGDDSGSGDTTTSDATADSLHVGRHSAPPPMHWNWVDYINQNGATVNYDEGAFFIVITTDSQPPTNGGANQVASPALFYWYKQIFGQGGDIAYDQKVWVWAKVHDGGRDPFSTASFHDNHGAYTIWIDPDQQINDVQLKASVPAPEFKNTPAAQKLKMSASKSMNGKPNHIAAVLKRKTPNHQPN